MRSLLLALAACSLPSSTSQALAGPVRVVVVAGLTADTGVAPRDGVQPAPDGTLWGSAWQQGPNRTDPPSGRCSSTGSWSSTYQTRFCPGSTFAVDASGALEVVHGFSPLDASMKNDDGYQPTSAPVYGGDGWMYGTTSKGGRPPDAYAKVGVGVLYRESVTTHEHQVLHTFCSVKACVDGAYPYGGVRPDGRGHLVLSTKAGGSGAAGGVAVFDLTTQTLTWPRGFAPVTYVRDATGKLISSYNADGGNPFGPPVVGWDGRMHVAPLGWGPDRAGAVLTITLDGAETIDAVLEPVASAVNSDTAAMGSQMVSGVDGRIVGTRPLAGANGTGEVYLLESDGSGYRPIFSFDLAPVNTAQGHYANATGAAPMGTPLEDLDGAIVEVTYYGGARGQGVLAKIARDGTEQVLYSFGTNPGDPLYPSSNVVRAGDGRLWGASQLGGPTGGGAVYRVEN